ncbi:hypothetical protein WJX79_006598 [Trebouxia sp. C0005]
MQEMLHMLAIHTAYITMALGVISVVRIPTCELCWRVLSEVHTCATGQKSPKLSAGAIELGQPTVLVRSKLSPQLPPERLVITSAAHAGQ